MDEKNLELYEGEEIIIRGKTYIVPGLSFGQLEQYGKVVERMSGLKKKSPMTPQLMQDITQLIHLSLSRNYPEITLEKVKDMVDTRNATRIVLAIMGGTGMEAIEATEDTQGETQPVALVK